MYSGQVFHPDMKTKTTQKNAGLMVLCITHKHRQATKNHKQQAEQE